MGWSENPDLDLQDVRSQPEAAQKWVFTKNSKSEGYVFLRVTEIDSEVRVALYA